MRIKATIPLAVVFLLATVLPSAQGSGLPTASDASGAASYLASSDNSGSVDAGTAAGIPRSQNGIYVSHFYTPDEATVFPFHDNTTVSIYDSQGHVVWGKTLTRGFPATARLSAGNYTIISTERISLLVGDPVNGNSGDGRGYYALDSEGKPCGTEFYTYLKGPGHFLVVFSYGDNNHVTISQKGEFSYSTVWQGNLDAGMHHVFTLHYPDNIMVTSTSPVSVLVTSSQFHPTFFIPSSAGNFYGDTFFTYLPGSSVLYLSSYNHSTHIDILDSETADIVNSCDLDQYERCYYNPPAAGFYSIYASNPITTQYISWGPSDRGMTYIADRSGTMIGTEFVYVGLQPVQIIAYEDGTTVDHYADSGELIDSYHLDAGDHVNTHEAFGRMMSSKPVSLAAIGDVGATFVPIPTESYESHPFPPAIIGVTHRPPQPTTKDSKVTVMWATDEDADSVLMYRVNQSSWTVSHSQVFITEHAIDIDISSLNGNDKVEYFVWSKDKDNHTTVDDNQGEYYSFVISPDIPQLDVYRLSVQDFEEYYKVNLFVQNVGIAEAKDIQIRERLNSLLVPTQNCKILPVNSYEYDVTVSVPDLESNDWTVVSYNVVPILYSHYDVYGIGLNTPSIASYKGPSGRSYSASFSDQYLLDSGEVLSKIRQRDYVIATNVNRMKALFKADATGQVLHEAAQFALARDGVVSCLETTDPYQIKKLIDSDWNGQLGSLGYLNGWKYLLLIGKTDIVPAWEITHDCTWDDPRKAAVADNLYADVKPDDHYAPELIVARLPGDDTNDFIRQMENGLSPIEADKAVLISGTGDGQDEFVHSVNEVNGFLHPYSSNTVRHWKDLSGTTNRFNIFKQDAIDADLIFYRDHGGSQCWCGDDTPVHTGNVGSVSFGVRHPIVWSIACWTGNIRQRCLADVFLEAGASVFIGATEPSPREMNNKFARKLAVYHNQCWFGRSIGEAFQHAKWILIRDNIHWYTTCYSDARFKQVVNEYNLYGDPKRGLAPEPVTGACQAQAAPQGPVDEPPPEYGTPPDTIEIVVPDYKVESVSGVDYVTIPGPEGTTFSEHDEPIVPAYVHVAYIDARFKIQDVSLLYRSEPELASGLHLPLASFEDDGPLAIGLATNGTGIFPNRDFIFDWKVFEEPNGNQKLVISILPFYYNKESTDIEFHKEYRFGVQYIESSVAISEITVSQDETPPGERVVASVHIYNGLDQTLSANLETEILDDLAQVVDVVSPVQVSLAPGENSVEIIWDTTGHGPGYYFFRDTVIYQGSLLDTEAKMTRLGGYSADAGELSIWPLPEQGFEIGDPVEIMMPLENTGNQALTGLATVRITHVTSSASVKEFVHDVELTPGETRLISFTWDTTSVEDGLYTIAGFLAYDGKTTEIRTADISTYQEIDISIHAEKEVYSHQEKIVVWVYGLDPSGESLLDLNLSGQVLRPDGTSFPLDFAYYPILGFHMGWFYVPPSYPDGVYEVEVIAQKTGYRRASDSITLRISSDSPRTAIDLLSFSASGRDDQVTLDWQTAAEIDNEGFNLWRAETADGPYAQINPDLIPAQGSPDTGASYQYVDSDVVRGLRYFYKLEDVDVHGLSAFHGPVSVTASSFRDIYLPLIFKGG